MILAKVSLVANDVKEWNMFANFEQNCWAIGEALRDANERFGGDEPVDIEFIFGNRLYDLVKANEFENEGDYYEVISQNKYTDEIVVFDKMTYVNLIAY